MNDTPERRFNFRAFWATLAVLAGIGLPWTGFENHLHQFDPFAGERHAWMAAHNILAALFLVAVVAHAKLNWRALARYVRRLPAEGLPLSREALAALAITVVLLLLSLGHTRIAGGGGADNQGATRVEAVAIAR